MLLDHPLGLLSRRGMAIEFREIGEPGVRVRVRGLLAPRGPVLGAQIAPEAPAATVHTA